MGSTRGGNGSHSSILAYTTPKDSMKGQKDVTP